MGAFHDVGVSRMSMLAKLMHSGLNEDQIDRAMQHLAGRDWRSVHASHLAKRFQDKGLIDRADDGTFLYDLEALIKKWIKDHELFRRR